ncbi:MAG: hypothetical protein JW837_05300 [Sedimentisphaerales bacterium]|nr:hypothetical protein [Sedimentisphaerales bacterium]
MNKNFEQPFGNQIPQGPGQQTQQGPSRQQNGLKQTFLNLKLSTWIKCIIVSLVLSVVAVFVAPEFTTAMSPDKTQQSLQKTNEINMYDYSQYGNGLYDGYGYREDPYYDYDEDEYYQDEYYQDDWYDDYGYESEEDLESGWYDDYETVDDSSYYGGFNYDSEENWYNDYETEEDDWSCDYEYEEDWSYDNYGSEDQWYNDDAYWYDDYEYQEDVPDYYYDD